METNWTYQEFNAFVLLYAASIDSKISHQELTLVRSMVNEEQFEKIHYFFVKHSDFEVLQQILVYKEIYIQSPADKSRLVEGLLAVLHSDSKYTAIEKNFMNLIHRLL